jgi:hypothetical protein
MPMPAQSAGRSGRHREEEEPADVQDQAEKPKSDNKESAVEDDLVDEIDRLLKEQLGFDEDEEVSPDEFNKKAALMVERYVQKGGQ